MASPAENEAVVREAVRDYKAHSFGDGLAHQRADEALAALAALRAQAEAGERPGPVPNAEGGPGNEETYWLRQKLQASIRHLRDVEDYYRLRGGTPDSYNMVRADRARSLYEQITEDFVNGKMNVPTMRERAEAGEQAREALREIAEGDSFGSVHLQEIARAALTGEGTT